MAGSLDISAIRNQFPALERRQGGRRVIFLDGPAGSQVPASVADAVRRYLLHSNANTHGTFATSLATDALLSEARRAAVDFLGTDDPDEIVWGPNMTTLTFSISRSLAREWKAGDEVVVTRLDHDANVTPWVMAAEDAGATVKTVDIDPADCTLDMSSLAAALTERTVLVAVTAASNAAGTVTPLAEIASRVHEVGAELFVDAVHYAPHRLIDVPAFGCDYLVCSPYKFFGPHLGMLWGRKRRMQALHAYKVRPADDQMPHRFESGTQSHEGIAGTLAAIDYLAGLATDPEADDRRARLASAFAAIEAHESSLCRQLLDGLARIPGYRVWGISDPARMGERVPTVSITHRDIAPNALAQQLSGRGIFAWYGNYYALELSRALGREPDGMVRLGLLHYNSAEEVDRLLEVLTELDQQ